MTRLLSSTDKYLRFLSSTGKQRESSFLMRFFRRFLTKEKDQRALKYCKVTGRFGPESEEYEFSLPLLDLVSQSDKDGKEPALDEDGNCFSIVVDLPDVPCDAEIPKIVEDICRGVMKENVPPVLVIYCSEVVRWIEGLPDLLPDVSRRSLLVLHLAKMARLGNEGMGISSSTLEWGFLCLLLVEATQLSTGAEQNRIATGLGEEIVFLQNLVSQGLGQVCHFAHFRLQQDVHFSRQHDRVLGLIMKFKFDTLQSILEHFRSFVFEDEDMVVGVVDIVDCCMKEHLKEKSFTMQQVLNIYEEFPNNKRPTDEELFRMFWRKCMSPEELVDLVNLIDYNNVPADIVKMLSEELLDMVHKLLKGVELDFVTVKKFVKIKQEKRIEEEKCDEELVYFLLKKEVDVRAQKLLAVTEGLRVLQKSTFLSRKDQEKLIESKKAFEIQRAENKKAFEIQRDESKKAFEIQRDESKKAFEIQRDAFQRSVKFAEYERDYWRVTLQEHKRIIEVERNTFKKDVELLEHKIDTLRKREGCAEIQRDESKKAFEIQRDAFQRSVKFAEYERDSLRVTLQEHKRIIEVERNMFNKDVELLEHKIDTLRKREGCAEIQRDEERLRAERETNALQEGKKLVESQLHAANRDLEVEMVKTTCQICYQKPRDALCLPCMHFHYCAQCLYLYHESKKKCPTCQAFTSGVLKCNLDL